MQFVSRSGGIVQATRWFRNGDHPHDAPLNAPPGEMEGRVVRYYRHPRFPGTTLCPACELPLRLHGWLDREDLIVCPGSWVVDSPTPEPRYIAWRYHVVPHSVFVRTHQSPNTPNLGLHPWSFIEPISRWTYRVTEPPGGRMDLVLLVARCDGKTAYQQHTLEELTQPEIQGRSLTRLLHQVGHIPF